MLEDHKPLFVLKDDKLVYVKYEKNLKDAIFRKTNSLSFADTYLSLCFSVEVHLPDGVVLTATREEIMAHKEVRRFRSLGGEVKWYYPLEQFRKS